MKEEIKPVIIEGKEIPGYFVSNLGKVYCARYSRKLYGQRSGFEVIIDPSRMREMRCQSKIARGGSSGSYSSAKVCLSIPDDILTEYDYRRRKSGGLRTIDRGVHQLVMSAFRPIDDYPPIPKDDWDNCPESAKQWICQTVLINHIDHNPMNNNVNNLEYVTPRENSRKATEHYGGNCANKNKVIIKKKEKKVITIMEFF